MARVVRYYDFWIARCSFLFTPFFYIGNQSACSATDIEIIHCIGADTGKLRPAKGGGRTEFRYGNDFANRASAQPACPKGKRLEKTIVQLRPFAAIRELLDDTSVKFRAFAR